MDVEARIDALKDARRHLLAVVGDLDEAQARVPELAIVNLPFWEFGHVGWFQERWLLRETGRIPNSRFEHADALFDSIAVQHHDRWCNTLPVRRALIEYVGSVLDEVERMLHDTPETPDLDELSALALAHEDMHVEALLYTRQTLGYPAPSFLPPYLPQPEPVAPGGDIDVPGGTYLLGSTSGAAFTFDNEHGQHEVELAPFSIARFAVTQDEFRAFVEDDGYAREELWSDAGRQWRVANGATHPIYWLRDTSGAWLRRHFDRWVALEPALPVQHVSWYEAEAFCRWAQRRLPTEAEWEAAACWCPDGGKRELPWGRDGEVSANTDFAASGCVPVDHHADGECALGCRQLVGNVWEWTVSDFVPYPGFRPGRYVEYSEPWFHTRKVLRGGAWASRLRMLRNSLRNFFEPERRDVFAGFRTCAR